uniref:Uncharacterized protein n=1 Tax=Rhizophora mucronata TaxID=61149 RepID=A0A2P2KZB7_RHIMU
MLFAKEANCFGFDPRDAFKSSK